MIGLLLDMLQAAGPSVVALEAASGEGGLRLGGKGIIKICMPGVSSNTASVCCEVDM